MKTKQDKNHIALFHTTLHGGGGERVLLDVAKALAARGNKVDLLIGTTKGQLSLSNLGAVSITDFDTPSIRSMLPKLMRYLHTQKPFVLMVTSEYTAVLALVAKFFSFSRVRVVVRVGNPYSVFQDHTYNFFDRYCMPVLVRALYPFAHSFVANARGIADDLAHTLHIPRKKIAVVYNPKNIADIQAHAKEEISHPWLSDTREVPVILTNARISKQKDFRTLLSAIARISETREIRLLVLGHGDPEEVMCFARELGIADLVQVAGFVQNPYAYMARADVFALASLWEGMPNALIEALICGVPSVASNSIGGGSREVLDPHSSQAAPVKGGFVQAEYGILVAPKDVEMLARAITEMLDNKTLREAYIRKGQERGKDFSDHEIITQYETILLRSDQ